LSFSQSNELEWTIDEVKSSHGGNYTCDAKNNVAFERETVLITVVSAPIVKVVPHHAVVKENSTLSFECGADNIGKDEASIEWIDEHGNLLQRVSER